MVNLGATNKVRQMKAHHRLPQRNLVTVASTADAARPTEHPSRSLNAKTHCHLRLFLQDAQSWQLRGGFSLYRDIRDKTTEPDVLCKTLNRPRAVERRTRGISRNRLSKLQNTTKPLGRLVKGC